MRINIDQLIDTACERAASDDFGADTWREGLEVLVGSLNTESALNDIGVGAMTDQIVGYLVNRLEIEQWYRRFPEIDEQQIVSPLFGLGLPRTGSTALSYLLAQDPARRYLRVWEANTPMPATGNGNRIQRPARGGRASRHRLHQRDVSGFRRHVAERGQRTAGVPAADGARLPVAHLRWHGVCTERTPAGCCSAT